MEGLNVVVEVACWMVDNVGQDWPSHSCPLHGRWETASSSDAANSLPRYYYS